MCTVKEPNYFNIAEDAQGNFELGPTWYRNLFISKSGLTGEATTAYTQFPLTLGVVARIYEMNPRIKLIYIVRNPIDRAISHYVHNVLIGIERRDIHKSLKGDTSRYLLTSMYFLQLQQYLPLFQREQICVLISEKMWADPQSALNAICDFLEVEHLSISGTLKRYSSTWAKLKRQNATPPVNEAQVRLWQLSELPTIVTEPDARTLGKVLGLSSEEHGHLSRRLNADICNLRRFVGVNTEMWDMSY